MKELSRCILVSMAVTVIACTGLKRPDMPLDPVCGAGRLDLLPQLLEKGGDVNEVDANGDRPISTCISLGRVDIAVELVRRGAELDYTNRTGETLEQKMRRFGHDASFDEFMKKLKQEKLLPKQP